jgi:hypothetical protein
MKEIIYKGTDFLSIEETLGDIIIRMGLVNMDCHNDSEPSDSALCDFTIEIKRKYRRTNYDKTGNL